MRSEEESTKSRLLMAARDHYLEVGPHAFSLREVARRAGVTAAAVYRHFEGKQALLDAVCEEGFRIFGSYLMESLKARDPMARIRAAGAQYLRFGLERPHDYRVIFMSDAPAIAAGVSPVTSTSFQFLVDRVRECMAAGAFRAGDPELVALSIWSHVHGLTSLRLSGQLAVVGDDATFRDVFAASVEMLLTGLAP